MNTAYFIVGQEAVIKPGTEDFSAVLTILMAAYYVFDLEYPRMYSQALGFLQTFLFEDPYRLETCKNYKFFLKKVMPFFEAELKKGEQD